MKSKTRQIFPLFVLSIIASFSVTVHYDVGLFTIIASVLLGVLAYYFAEAALTKRLHRFTSFWFRNRATCLLVYGVIIFWAVSIFFYADGDSQALVIARAITLSTLLSVVIGLIVWVVVSYRQKTAIDRMIRKEDKEMEREMSPISKSNWLNLDD